MECPACKGEGCNGIDYSEQMIIPCEECGGTGEIKEDAK